MFKLKTGFTLSFCVLFVLMSLSIRAQKPKDNTRTILNFDADWRFLKDDAKGAELLTSTCQKEKPMIGSSTWASCAKALRLPSTVRR